jgi:His-Xaa-Ser system protein HxsD
MKNRFITSIDNFDIDKEQNKVMLSINPKLHRLEIIFSAAYTFIDSNYVIIEGDPQEEIVVQLIPKNKKTNLEKLAREFNNELVNYEFYTAQNLKNGSLREAIIKKVFRTHNS